MLSSYCIVNLLLTFILMLSPLWFKPPKNRSLDSYALMKPPLGHLFKNKGCHYHNANGLLVLKLL